MKNEHEETGKPTIPVKKHTSRSTPLKYKIDKDDSIDFTAKAAYDFLDMDTFQGERPVRQSHVQYLYDEEVAGRFIWHLVTIAIATLQGRSYRINGQHTAWMRIHVEDQRRREVRLMVYKVDDSEQLRALYSAYDRNAPRTSQHVSKVQLIGTEAAEGIPPSYLGKLVSGYRVFLNPDYKTTMTTTDVITRIKAQAALFNTVGRFHVMHYDDANFVRRSALVGAMFATFSQAVKASDEFWTPICSGLGMENRSDHRWLLRRYIESHGHTISGGRDIISQEDLYRVCINMWNHWRTNTPIKSVRVPGGEDRPKVKA